MYLRLETYNFGLESAREHQAGHLTSVKRKVILALLRSDLENQKKLSRKFWSDWDGESGIVKLRIIAVKGGRVQKETAGEIKGDGISHSINLKPF